MISDRTDNEAIRQGGELTEGSEQKTIRQMENDPATKSLQQLEISSIFRDAASLQQTDFQKLVNSLAEARSSIAAFSNSQQWAKLSSAMAAAHSAIVQPETLAALSDLKNIVAFSRNAILPLAEQLQTFSIAAASAVHPMQEQLQRIETWQTSLADRMAKLQTPWAFEDHLGVSIVGFARIARLHDISSGPAPFHPAGEDVFTEELGNPVAFDEEQNGEEREAARIDAGMNAEVLAFPPASYPHVLFSAGFELQIETVTSVKTENGDETGLLDAQHSNLFSQIENRLRLLIETELRQLEGELWLRRRVPGELRKRWQARKEVDHDRRRDSYPLLYYADFMDLADVICEGRNWNEIFHRFFVNKPDFQASMQRLAPVRNTIGHNRPLVRADQITLFAEGFRILNALGVRM